MVNDANEKTRHWLGKLTALRPAIGRGNTRGKAPHKPLLLLCLIDMAETGAGLPGRTFVRTPSLVLRFRTYGSFTADRWPTKLDLRLPFYHLSSQEFWAAFTADMRPATSPNDCAVCELDRDFHALLADPDFRLKARLLLISRYFEPAEQAAFYESFGFTPPNLGPAVGEQLVSAGLEAAKLKGRSAKFQVRVVDDYHHVCALTGYRCVTTDGASVVDAAHIESWAETRNDDLTNGLALSKTAHWMFDEGLWTVDDEMRVVVHPTRFLEVGPEASLLRTYAGRHLQFDPKAKLRPAVECLRRHRMRHRAALPPR
ncbi:MAG: HNH endonuclease [Opitutae bacterium]|nr:HNH endonuclease [Opitutae bacterium]